jgi:hypothetical protein
VQQQIPCGNDRKKGKGSGVCGEARWGEIGQGPSRQARDAHLIDDKTVAKIGHPVVSG